MHNSHDFFGPAVVTNILDVHSCIYNDQKILQLKNFHPIFHRAHLYFLNVSTFQKFRWSQRKLVEDDSIRLKLHFFKKQLLPNFKIFSRLMTNLPFPKVELNSLVIVEV